MECLRGSAVECEVLLLSSRSPASCCRRSSSLRSRMRLPRFHERDGLRFLKASEEREDISAALQPCFESKDLLVLDSLYCLTPADVYNYKVQSFYINTYRI